MFGTVILDAYRSSERKQMADAINEICDPRDSYGWSSAGLYCYWDYDTHEVLYIGLATDLATRFKQHNGMLHSNTTGSKVEEINEYFKTHEMLGYTIFVQSPLSQPINSRNKDKYNDLLEDTEFTLESLVDDLEIGRSDIRRAEGILIEAYRRKNGRYSKWNKIGGDIEGQKMVMPNNINIVKSFVEPELYECSPIVSRSTIRELADNPSFVACEEFLHAVRMRMLSCGQTYEDALDITIKDDEYNSINRLYELNYFDKKLVV